ncbi:hypothetical protein [Bdellovibrio sp. KM01]|uniref:hypothetical protein n=1 Tax=Bdellovibrio sp. KM01 TaxID=2748865 RepID=UPI0015E9AC30|nr:hypothetical protein [Bdellovibrio sp. KM01]QLY26589.1 hypothetical protein HW988_06110 [Bdellovibrio sp. KM01]
MRIFKPKTILGILASGLIFFCTGAAQAEDTGKECINPELLRYALSQYQFEDINGFGEVTKTYSEMDVCDQGIFKVALQGIDYLRKMPNGKIPSNFQTLISKEGGINFLKKRIKKIQIETADDSDCEESTAARVFFSEADQGIMHLCPSMKKSTPNQAAGFLVHEARHIDGFVHVDCTHGILESTEGACDNTYQEQGSYGISLGFQFQVYMTTKNEAVKQESRSNIVLGALNNFNKAPLGLQKGGIFLDDDNILAFYQGNQEYRLAEFTDKTIGLTLHAGLPTVFFENGTVTKYDFTREWILREGTLIKAFSGMSPSERAEIEDIYANVDNCFLFKNDLKCMDGDGFLTYRFNELKPVAFADRYQTWNNSLLLLMSDGKVYSMPKPKDFAATRDADLKVDVKAKTYPNITSFAEMENGYIMGISNKGFMMVKKSKDTPWVRAKEFGDFKMKKIVPYYWSKRLEDL